LIGTSTLTSQQVVVERHPEDQSQTTTTTLFVTEGNKSKSVVYTLRSYEPPTSKDDAFEASMQASCLEVGDADAEAFHDVATWEHVVRELHSTERDFMHRLEVLWNVFLAPLQSDGLRAVGLEKERYALDIIFGTGKLNHVVFVDDV
jgi:hypothetical protein